MFNKTPFCFLTPSFLLFLPLYVIHGIDFLTGFDELIAALEHAGSSVLEQQIWLGKMEGLELFGLMYMTHRFIFDDEALELQISGKETDNIVVGGQNRWSYDSFVNWEFWWPGFPVLVYYKVPRCT